MSGIFDRLGDAMRSARENAHDVKAATKAFAEEKMLEKTYVDLTIQFIGASGLPKMDVIGSADPYFVAKLDHSISYVSTVQTNTLAPVWNEVWMVKNVPTTADLNVEVMDKDVGAARDDYIGCFTTSLTPGAKEVEIQGPTFGRKNRGTFWLKIESKPADDEAPEKHPYLFAGPIRFSRHFSPTVGRLTKLNDDRLYSTWKIYIVGIPLFFGDEHQHWNTDYKAAQSIFGQGPTSLAIRSTIQAGHRMLYARTTRNGFGVIEQKKDVMDLFVTGGQKPSNNDDYDPNIEGAADEQNAEGTDGSGTNGRVRRHFSRAPTLQENPMADRVKPAVYTYIMSSEDDSFRFSETGAAFFVDFASKHALHANCCATVRYAGEFHLRPAIPGGWDAFNDDTPDSEVNWELVIDNNSGTYAPDKKLLPRLQKLLEINLPGVGVVALDREDPELVASREACREYALRCRGVKTEELQPHAIEGEVTLSSQASVRSAEPPPVPTKDQ